VKSHHIVSSRLSALEKKELVEAFREGVSASTLAKTYGCSPNTVSRTVKALLSTDEYNALKRLRSKGRLSKTSKEFPPLGETVDEKGLPSEKLCVSQSEDLIEDSQSKDSLLVSENDSLEDWDELIPRENNADLSSEGTINDFHEIVPLIGDFPIADNQNVVSKPLTKNILPESVYLVVDRSVELEIRYLKDFSEFGILSDDDQERKVLCLFSNQRSAKRHCGRNQRVIKIPDSGLFQKTIPFLLAKGITRLILESTLITLEQ